jgi:hypothetical protein
MVRWTSRRPFSADPGEWSSGAFLTDTSTRSKGVVDAAISPDGTQLAVAANFGSRDYRLWLVKSKTGIGAGAFALGSARRTRMRACKVAWRGDGRELLITEADKGCSERQGALTRVPVDDPSRSVRLAAKANDPAYPPRAGLP